MRKIYRLAWFPFSLFAPTVMALPEGGQVTAGNATLHQADNQSLVIEQHSNRVAIEYDQFNIASTESVTFQQPGRDSIALNRVTSGSPSQIFGRLSANGQVFLINPGGVLFAPGAQVDVGGLIAATLNLSDDDFMSGKFQFHNTENSDAAIVNRGTLAAVPEGYIALVATQINNEGLISADLGQVALISADTVQVQIAGSLLGIETSQASWQGLVQNQGIIHADGGTVLLKADTGGQLYQTVINNSGEIRANRLEERNGEIWLTSSGEGDIWLDGSVDASARTTGSGGNVLVEGERIALTGTLRSEGAGDGDGGNIQMQARDTIALTSGSQISVNAGINGNGGNVIVRSPGKAIMQSGASIDARGGSLSGNGGFVDVSGLEQVHIAGSADLTAANGKTGTWLIDPYDITIIAPSIDSNYTISGSSPFIISPNNTGSSISVATLLSSLASANVEIQTTTDGSEAGDITVADDIDFDGFNGKSLALLAAGSINILADISDQDTGTSDIFTLALSAADGISVADGTLVNPAHLSMVAGGTVTLPSAGLNIGESIVIDALDILDTDASPRQVILNAPVLNITTSLDGGNSRIDTTAITTTLSKDTATTSRLSLFKTDAGDLTVTNRDTGYGSLELNLADGNLIVQPLAINQVSLKSERMLITSANDYFDTNGVHDVKIAGDLGGLNFSIHGTNTDPLNIYMANNDLLTLQGSAPTPLTFINANGNIRVLSAPALWNADLSFQAANSFRIPDTGIGSTGTLSITSGLIRDTNQTVTLNAPTLVISSELRNGDEHIQTTATTASVTTVSSGSSTGTLLTLEKSDLGNLTLNGSSIFDSLSVSLADGNLDVSAPVSVAGTFTVFAHDMSDATINGTQADLNLDALSDSLHLTTALDAISLDLNGSIQAVTVTEADDLTLTTQNGTGDFTLTSTGALTIPDAGLTSIGMLSLIATDIHDSDYSLTLIADRLLLAATAAGTDLTLNTSVNQADISVTGRSLTLSESNGLTLQDLSAPTMGLDGNALASVDGNLFLALDSGDLTVNSDVRASDITTNGIRTGLIDITLNGGALNLGTGGAVQLVSTNTADYAVPGSLGSIPSNQTVIRIRQLDNTDQSAPFVLGNGSGNDVLIETQGGDIYLDSLGGATLSASTNRQVFVNSDVTLTAYNTVTDASDGNVNVGDSLISGTVLARSNRAIRINTATPVTPPSEPPNPPVVAEDIASQIADSLEPIEVTGNAELSTTPPLSKPPAEQLFVEVFGACQENSRTHDKCRTHRAVRRFMNSLLIDGDLPY